MKFLVVLRAVSSVHLDAGATLRIVPKDGSSTPVEEVRIASEYSGEDPECLRVEIRGRGEDIEAAVATLGGLAGRELNLLTLLANGAIAVPELRVAYDVTPQTEDRKFLQVVPMGPLVHPVRYRVLSLELYRSAHEGLDRHAESGRLLRAMEHYAIALRTWQPFSMTMPAEHLYMAVENLSPIYLGREGVGRKMSKHELALSKGHAPRNESDRSHLSRLDAELRRRYVFGGAESIHDDLARLSTGLEHGFMPFEEIRRLSKQVCEPAAHCIRRAIFAELGCTESLAPLLTERPYCYPLAAWAPQFQLDGTLSASDSSLAPGMPPSEAKLVGTWQGRFREGGPPKELKPQLTGKLALPDPSSSLTFRAASIALPGSGNFAIMDVQVE